ncbi:MAG: FAD-binding oxidoreductase [Acidobacteria bacterium]|nr:FAD-binding oxidoreductase [Acidobacteriota bacterium]
MQQLKPTNAAELADAMAGGRAIRLLGNNTKSRWAGPGTDAAVEIRTTALNQVLAYEPRDLTVSVGAGMPWAEFTALLAANHQMVPLDPPYAASATVGGVIAANHSGPRRRLFGTARDLVIGMQYATVEGKLIQSGGMVVKNVAGLDMGKLMIGSWGTLAAIASVNFKLIPRDKYTRTFIQRYDTVQAAFAERSRILHGVLQPAAVDIVNLDGGAQWILAIGVGGSQALIDRYSTELASFEPLDLAAERTFWHKIESFPGQFLAQHPGGAILRAASTLRDQPASVAGHRGPSISRAANGVTYLYFEEAPSVPPVAAQLMEAGPDHRSAGQMWPAPGDDFAVMENIKRMLDPKQLLNKGRFYGRI